MDLSQINILILAYLGDSIYESFIREFLVNRGIPSVDKLQKESIKYVSAKSQSKILKYLLENDELNEEELNIVKRARNYKSSRHPKNCDILTYKHATALEALVGYLYLKNNKERLNIIMNFVLKGEKY